MMSRSLSTLLALLTACVSTPSPADVPEVTISDASSQGLIDVSAPDAVDVSAPDVVDVSAPDVVDVSAPDEMDASAPDVVDAAGACGRAGARLGRWYQTVTSRGVTRQFYVSVPANYDPARRYPLVVGLHGRDYDGVRMRDYLALESQAPNDWAIFVYPDALRRTWGTLQATGWQNGPVASMTSSYGGTDDLAFIDDMLAWMRDAYCLDPTRVFATGQSWGGDFSNVVGCFRGDVFRAVAPVAANGDYYLPTRSDAAAPCVGAPAVWALHGINDTSIPFTQGGRYRDFWVRRHGCDASASDPLTFAGAMGDDTCVAYRGCAQPVRWCAYNAASGHQIPRAYYPREVVGWFRSF
jgi:polyhydroxybutyrate depolymerase